MCDKKAYMQIKITKAWWCIATNYRAKQRQPTQELNLGGLQNIDIYRLLVAGAGFNQDPTISSWVWGRCKGAQPPLLAIGFYEYEEPSWLRRQELVKALWTESESDLLASSAFNHLVRIFIEPFIIFIIIICRQWDLKVLDLEFQILVFRRIAHLAHA